MKIYVYQERFCVCEVDTLQPDMLKNEMCFIMKTKQDSTVVCPENKKPSATLACEMGWRAFRIQGVLDFSLVGILANIATILAEANVSIYTISTYQTDIILVKEAQLATALTALQSHGYEIISSM